MPKKLATSPDDKKEQAAKDAVKAAAVDARGAAEQYALTGCNAQRHRLRASAANRASRVRYRLIPRARGRSHKFGMF
jgi:hypothetical protein